MGGHLVCKFGGSSLANAEQIEKVRRIVSEDARRHFVVVSAPGKTGTIRPPITSISKRRSALQKTGKAISAKRCESNRRSSIMSGPAIRSGHHDTGIGSTSYLDKKRIDFFASAAAINAKIIARYFRKKGMMPSLLPEDIGFCLRQVRKRQSPPRPTPISKEA